VNSPDRSSELQREDSMDEFSLIEVLTTALGAKRGAMEGVGDDGAILKVPADKHLVVSTDTLVEGVHFDDQASPGDVGFKALAVSLSDLAAMGARPAWFFLSLTLPSMDESWARRFALGMHEAARGASISIAGGDVTSGPLSITVTVCGLVRPGSALLRSGALPGDVIGISGPTGMAGKALLDLRQGKSPAPACVAALHRPSPRLGFGQALCGLAHSCIDISDGLLADAGHIARASGVGIKIDLERLPNPPELADLDDEARWNLQLGGGDDYELCFTAAPDSWEDVSHAAQATGADAIRIGEVFAGDECICVKPDGDHFRPIRSGYVHGVP
jgi:thiamine-monophosphate kinase